MAKPASSSPARVTITKHGMAASVLRHAQTGRYVLLPKSPVVVVPFLPPPPPQMKKL
jgi:hypothetical protein